MLFLIALIFAMLTAFLLDKPLKKCPAAFYIAAAVLTAASVVILQSDIEIPSRFVRDYIIGIFSRGALGAAFWAVVMWAGALPNGSAPIKKLMPIRGELSITAAILTLSHVITYGIQYISSLFKGRTGSDFWTTSLVCLVMVLIMVPLTVMSFKAVRKKMNAKLWKKLQRAAYVFYALIYVHILVLFVPKAQHGREGYFLSVLVYSAVFIGYAAMRIRKAYAVRKKPEAMAVPNVLCVCAVVIPLAVLGFFSRGQADSVEKTVTASEDSHAVFTFEPETTASNTENVSSGTTVSAASLAGTSSKTDVSTDTDKTGASTEPTTDTETTAAEEATEDEKAEEEAPEEDKTEAPAEEHTEKLTEAEVTYKYKNGEYSASAEGYAGKVHVKLKIENDKITSISAWADDDDPEYFSDAMNKVIPQIAGSLSADVDACSGATYSSKGIMEAAKKALEQAALDK